MIHILIEKYKTTTCCCYKDNRKWPQQKTGIESEISV